MLSATRNESTGNCAATSLETATVGTSMMATTAVTVLKKFKYSPFAARYATVQLSRVVAQACTCDSLKSSYAASTSSALTVAAPSFPTSTPAAKFATTAASAGLPPAARMAAR